MQNYLYKKVVIKIGSNVLTNEVGELDEESLKVLSIQVSSILKSKIEIILVSSGAVAAGKSMINLANKSDSIASRQVFAAVGQVKLLQKYYQLFQSQAINCAQVLVTKEDFRDRLHYLNLRNCFEALVQNNILPIVNENDVISVTELMFTDNDELAGLIATMINADLLLILTNVDGIFDGDPKNISSKLISKVEAKLDFSKFIHSSKSDFGRGGMITKSTIAKKVASNGITVKIANGKTPNIILKALNDAKFEIGTTFIPFSKSKKSKSQISFSESFAKGEIVINEGAKQALFSSKANSLLTVGIVEINGDFQIGDIVRVLDTDRKIIGLGKVQYNSKKAFELIGHKNQKPLVHYDYLYLIQD